MQDALRLGASSRARIVAEDGASDVSGPGSETSGGRRRPEVSSSNTSLDSAGARQSQSVDRSSIGHMPSGISAAQVRCPRSHI